MPAGPGESLLTTVFADVHYYFDQPSAKPQHHRFDRGSYLYLFHNAHHRLGKLEIANHAGTPDQDAFSGYLNAVTIQYSYLQPTLFTVTVHASYVADSSSWHLPGFNERNEQQHMYPLHTIDLYLWTEKDAATLMNHLKATLSPGQLEIKNAPVTSVPPEHRDSMSPIVQQLEKTAIGSQFPARALSVASAQSLPGPPTPHASGDGPPVHAPMAYNPAAPAAPEPVTYREKTPPPPDDGTGTGLKSAAKYDTFAPTQYAAAPFEVSQGSTQTTPQSAYFAGAVQHTSKSSQGSFQGPPSNPAPPPAQRQPSFGPLAQSTLPQAPSFTGPPHQAPFLHYTASPSPNANYPGTPGFNAQVPPTPTAPPAYSPGTLPHAFGASTAPPQLQQQQPQPQHAQHQQAPVGGDSTYSYTASTTSPSPQQQQQQQSADVNAYGGYTGDMHSQVYRPTEAESATHGKPKRTRTADGSGKPPKVTESFGNLEGKVGKYLNKLDKLW